MIEDRLMADPVNRDALRLPVDVPVPGTTRAPHAAA
jgi:hypothetical protein